MFTKRTFIRIFEYNCSKHRLFVCSIVNYTRNIYHYKINKVNIYSNSISWNTEQHQLKHWCWLTWLHDEQYELIQDIPMPNDSFLYKLRNMEYTWKDGCFEIYIVYDFYTRLSSSVQVTEFNISVICNIQYISVGILLCKEKSYSSLTNTWKWFWWRMIWLYSNSLCVVLNSYLSLIFLQYQY